MKPRIPILGTVILLLLCQGTSIPAAAWGNGSSSSSTYPYYGVHDVIAEFAYKNLKNYNTTMANWLTNWYVQNGGDFQGSFSPSSGSPGSHDNYLAYTDDPDSSIQDWDNHVYYVHAGGTQGAPSRVAQLYNNLVTYLTAYLKNGSQKWSKEEHYAAYYAGLLTHYFADITQYGHTEYTLKDHTHPAYDPDGETYHGYYESGVWGTAGISALISALNGMSYTIKNVSDVSALTINLAKWVNSHDGTTAAFTDTDGTQHYLGSTYVYMLNRFTSQYDAGITYNGMRGYDAALWTTTVQHIRAAVENLTTIFYTAYTTALNASDTVKPSITITSPANQSIVSASTITVYGIASDNIGIQKVEISRDGTTWVLCNGTFSWSGTLTLNTGTNTVYARATDTAGNMNTTWIVVTVVPQTENFLDGEVWMAFSLLAMVLGASLVNPRRKNLIRKKNV
ncbi:MAG: Ig-like domain-containing protein [Thermoplasmata archaeon]|nr:Ig-like domain-containing protein [Thermoplasmata archaeon]